MKNFLLCLLSYCCGVPFFASGQAIRTALVPPSNSLRITNDSLLKNYTNITLHWEFLVNGVPRQRGTVPGLTLLPGHPRMLHLPLKPTAPDEESYIKVDYRPAPGAPLTSRARLQPPAPTTHSQPVPTPVLATQTLPLKRWAGDLHIPATGELSFTDSNNIFTINSPAFHLSFDKESGWIQQYTVNGQTLFTDSNGLRPTLPSPPHLQLFSTSTGSQMVIVRTEYTVPELTCLLHLSYTMNSNGALLVESTLETDTTRADSIVHSVPFFGIRCLLPQGSYTIDWYGLSEAPVDSLPSLHHATMDSLASLHHATRGTGATEATTFAFIAKEVRSMDVLDPGGKGFRITADSNFLPAITGDPLVPNLDLYNNAGTPSSQYPIHRHLVFRLTSLPILSHPIAKPI